MNVRAVAIFVILIFANVAKAQVSELDYTRAKHSPIVAHTGNPSSFARIDPIPESIPWSPTPASVPSQWTASGTEFYACFLSVAGSNDGDPSSKDRSLFLSARAPTRAVIELLRSTYRDTVLVTPGSFTRVVLPDGIGLERDEYELPLPRALYIHSNEILTVYGFAHNYLSSDGFLIYPVQTLGTNYIVMSERNALNYPLGQGDPNPRSEFAVVATQDNTTVTLKLTATSYSGRLLADSTYAVHLNRGDVYPVMARDTGTHIVPVPAHPEWDDYYQPWQSGPDCDLTGSLISSDKPIAVFSGHERAASPSDLEYDYTGATRDHLAEQMLPLPMWGTQFAVIPTGQDFNGKRLSGGDMVRVVSGYDGTTIKINGAPVATLARGKYYEFMSGPACYIESGQPVMVAKFMQDANKNTDAMGDPDLTLVRPLNTWANYYTLPGGQDQFIFTESYLLVVCDSSATKTTLRNGAPIKGATWKPIAGTSYVYSNLSCGPEAQRIESPMPCYAETYAFGLQDSYRYAGGGDFKYIDSLFAVDLDFHAVVLGKASDLASPLHATFDPPGSDTILVYGYEWVSGDTANFTLQSSVGSQPLKVAPLRNLNVPFRFHPDQTRQYAATLRVWSSAPNDVFINLKGLGIVPQIEVFPDTIDFGRVRIGHRRDSLFTIANVGTSKLDITNLDFQTSITDADFTADSLKGVGGRYSIDPSSSVTDSVHFTPSRTGFAQVAIPIYSTDPVRGTTNPPTVILLGTGVEPRVYSQGHDFGSLRVDSTSPIDTIPIVNRGSDQTTIDSVSLADSTDIADFTISFDTLPPGLNFRSVFLQYVGEGHDTEVTFTVNFHPQSLGKKRLIVRIHTIDNMVVLDTIAGEGVEPLVEVQPQVIDFGTITVQPNPQTPPPVDSSFTVFNVGTMPGELDSLVCSDKAHFLVLLNKPNDTLDEQLPENASLPGTAIFFVIQEGDFIDTILVHNDTRYSLYPDSLKGYIPMIILKAKVRTGPVEVQNITFDTITTCAPNLRELIIHNPYPVEVHIDSIAFIGDTAGFARGPAFIFPINIAPDSIFRLPIQYIFPSDSLNGPQQVTIILYQRRGGGEQPVINQAIATVYRMERTLTLHAMLPKFVSSAGDILPLRLPITIQGPRDAVPELNSWTLKLTFSNDLFEPVGVDTTGSLTVAIDAGYSLNTSWDQSTRTYTITVTDAAASDPAKLANDLLLSVLMRAYVTTDTVVTVTPTFTFLNHPCSYNLQPFTLQIPFADDCGMPTIRAFMRGENPLVNFGIIRPDPARPDNSNGVSISYDALESAHVFVTVSDINGNGQGRIVYTLTKGTGEIVIPRRSLPVCGSAFITLEVSDANGAIQSRKTLKCSIEP